MVVADRVFREEATRKVHIAGTFNRISAPVYPAIHGEMALFLAITDMHPGEHGGRITFRYLDSDEPAFFEAQGPIRADNPLQVVEMQFAFRNIVFEKPGILEIAFYLDGEPVQSRKFQLVQAQPDHGVQDG